MKYHETVANYLKTLKPSVIRKGIFPKYVLNRIVKIDKEVYNKYLIE